MTLVITDSSSNDVTSTIPITVTYASPPTISAFGQLYSEIGSFTATITHTLTIKETLATETAIVAISVQIFGCEMSYFSLSTETASAVSTTLNDPKITVNLVNTWSSSDARITLAGCAIKTFTLTVVDSSN